MFFRGVGMGASSVTFSTGTEIPGGSLVSFLFNRFDNANVASGPRSINRNIVSGS